MDLICKRFSYSIVNDLKSLEFVYPHDAIAYNIYSPALIKCYLQLYARAKLFFKMMLLKSWLSIASSVHILSMRECSYSSVFSYWTSDTSTPSICLSILIMVASAISIPRHMTPVFTLDSCF